MRYIICLLCLSSCALPTAPSGSVDASTPMVSAPVLVPPSPVDAHTLETQLETIQQLLGAPDAQILPPQRCHASARNVATARVLWSTVVARIPARTALRFNIQAVEDPAVRFAGRLVPRGATPGHTAIYSGSFPVSAFHFSSEAAAGAALQKAANELRFSVTVTVNGKSVPICGEFRMAKVTGQVAFDTIALKGRQ